MISETSHIDADAGLPLSGDWTIREAADLKTRLEMAVDVSRLNVDTSDLASIDVACLQLLVAAVKSAQASHCHLTISAPDGGAFRAALDRSALTVTFQPLLSAPANVHSA